MMLTFPETVTILRPGPPNLRTGDQATGGAETTVEGCRAWPAASTETDFKQDTVFVGYTLVVPPGTDIAATDRVRLYGQVWQVTGEPARWRSPVTGWEPGIQVALRRVTG